FYNCNDSITK
ncbi:CPXV166 protein, partial [Monkeypox virus]